MAAEVLDHTWDLAMAHAELAAMDMDEEGEDIL